MDRKQTLILFFLLIFSSVMMAKPRLCLFPFQSVGVDSISLKTSYLLLQQELEKNSLWELVIPTAMAEVKSDWLNLSGIVELSRQWRCDLAMNLSFSRLGEKIIISYRLIDAVHDSILVSDQTTSSTVDDLDIIIQRVSRSVISGKPFQSGGELGLITTQETQQIKTRQALMYGGLDFGYLFPQSGFDQKKQRSFCLDFISTYENKGHLVYGMVAIRKGFALTLGYSYMLIKSKDHSPYIGTGFGFHWIDHSSNSNQISNGQKPRGDGFELIAKTGFMGYRTYNFRLVINLDWSYTFNDYNDQSLTLTIGLLHAGSRFLGVF